MRICAYAKQPVRTVPDPVKILAALAEPTRFAAMAMLSDGGEHCVCELMRRLGATQSRMSRHMKILKDAGLVTDRRDAQWVRYRRNAAMPGPVAAIVDAALGAAVPENHGERTAA
ncbi:ArsR/SmtB family transcription factor [Oricola nitratireducens]|jgi:ArsR family transcriptional regulator|uniref:ArsR/SmtB family transcription factor n=1 Tax=Oricola nitratireducens TaxID=2775868 RepID=UPI0018661FA9|nr:metalloregulator ArsR/SmtB family transcription factor [Oricola nitratireducens]